MSETVVVKPATEEPAVRTPRPPREAYWYYGPIAMALFLVFWEVATYWSNVPELFLPRPSVIVVTLYDLIRNKGLLVDLGVTLYRIFAGFLLAAVVGITLGILMGTSRRIYAICDIFIAAIYPIPKISLLPLVVIWLGSGNMSLVTLSALAAVFPILVNTIVGVRQCDEGLILAARDLGATRTQIQRKVVLPAAIPSIFGGLRLALGISIIMVVAAEMQLSKYGIGARLTFAGSVLETGQVFAMLVLLAIVGVLLTKGQEKLDRFIGRWRVR
jgi:ABC-type nitrate/sulfonate/bicarbonate transport system permease component